MIEAKPHSMQVHDKGYCSKISLPLPPIQTIEQVVKVIEKILPKTVLCYHDVENIKEAYRKIDLLEKQTDKIPEHSSHYVLKKIVEKVEMITRDKMSAQEFISLYHLRKFSDKGLQLDECFKSLSS